MNKKKVTKHSEIYLEQDFLQMQLKTNVSIKINEKRNAMHYNLSRNESFVQQNENKVSVRDTAQFRNL